MESMNYFLIRRRPFAEIKALLKEAKITALVVDGVLSGDDDRWVVVEAPRALGCTVPGDYATFSVLSDPWPRLRDAFDVIVEIFVSEGQKNWSLKCWSERAEKLYSFSAEEPLGAFSFEDDQFISSIFGLPFVDIVDCLKPEKAYGFCSLIGCPYLEMEMQDGLQDVLPEGAVVFASELPDQL